MWRVAHVWDCGRICRRRLVLFGGYGSKVMLEIAERLDRSKLDLQLIFICGRNEKLAKCVA